MKSARILVIVAIVATLSIPLSAANWADRGTYVYHPGPVTVGIDAGASLFTLYPSTTGINFRLYEYTYFGSLYGSWRTVLGGNVKASESTNDRMEYAVSHGSYGGIALLMDPSRGFAFHTAPPPATAGNTFNSERMMLDLSGNLGIGTTTPTSKLHVVGNAYVSGTLSGGNIQATYQDLAEWVPANEDLDAGTVVVLNPNETNAVIAASGEYDTTVAGVVSAQPGITLGVAGDKKEMIATTGRVRVKADTTGGAIRVGDLLVTSGKAGHAMRSTPIDVGGAKIHRPGTIIGKALEPLAEGEGEILVLLSMQ